MDRRVDLEVSFADGNGGVWRSRALNFEGRFEAVSKPPKSLILKDDKSVLTGTVRRGGLLSGSTRQLGQDGGSFELQELPACYRPWWGQVAARLKGGDAGGGGGTFKLAPSPKGEGSSIVIVSPGGRSADGGGRGEQDEDEKDTVSMLDAVMGRLFGGQGEAERSAQKPSRKNEQLSAILGFSMRPDEVKAYLDKYVIKQTAAKEMLAVAICDHYNRAREELSGYAANAEPADTSGDGSAKQQQSDEKGSAPTAGEAGVAAKTLADPEVGASATASIDSKEGQGAVPPATEADAKGIKFTDTDGDVIELRLQGTDIVEYLNGKLEIASVTQFDVDREKRTYKDDTGSGNFGEGEDLEEISKRFQALLKDQQVALEEREERKNKNYTKPNILLLGPTGSGKTYLLRNLAQLIGVPFVKADATKFTETGYVGRDAEDLMRDLLNAADGDAELAQVGIVYVDEIDKMSAEDGGGVSTFRRGTQSTFLKLLEDTEVSVSRGGRMGLMMEGSTTVSTRHVLFVFSGAFSQLDKSLQEKHRQETSGFGFARETKSADESCKEGTSFLHKAGTEELVKAGLEPEFVGRIPVRVALGTLSEDDLFLILKDAKDGATSQLVDDFRRYGIALNFTDDSLRSVAKLAYKEGTGARALVTILEGALRRFKFHMPRMVSLGCTTLEVTSETIEKSEEELQKLLDEYPLPA